MTAARDRANYVAQRSSLIEAMTQRDECKRRLDASDAEINSPPPDWDCDKWLSEHGRLERALAYAEHLVGIRRDVWYSMPTPKPARKRRTILVDGVRTKLEYA
jgi:hypothetical protein